MPATDRFVGVRTDDSGVREFCFYAFATNEAGKHAELYVTYRGEQGSPERSKTQEWTGVTFISALSAYRAMSEKNGAAVGGAR